MVDYRVKLDIYNGPVDLLLYLIRRDEIDIYDIPITKITQQYLEYVEVLQQIDINVAGEFLVMAATLMEIKSALLLPRPETPEGEAEDDLSDPRLELVRQLLEYKRFKDLAGNLSEAADQQANRFGRSQLNLQSVRDEEQQRQKEFELESLQIWDLFDAFSRIMKATHILRRGHEVIQDDTPIDIYETDILDLAQKHSPLLFEEVFQGRNSRGEMVGLFLALLELIRQRLVRIEQEKSFGPIYIYPQTEEPAEMAVARAVSEELKHLPSRVNPDKSETQSAAESPAATAAGKGGEGVKDSDANEGAEETEDSEADEPPDPNEPDDTEASREDAAEGPEPDACPEASGGVKEEPESERRVDDDR